MKIIKIHACSDNSPVVAKCREIAPSHFREPALSHFEGGDQKPRTIATNGPQMSPIGYRERICADIRGIWRSAADGARDSEQGQREAAM